MWTDHPVPRCRQGPAGLLAPPRRGRRRSSTTSPTRLEHPLPGRPLPGPVRARQEDVCPPADPRVRRGVHPRLHARPRPSTSSAWNPTLRAATPRPAQHAPRHRPGLRLRPLPARRLPPPPRAVGEESPRRRPLGADLPRPVLGPRRGQEPLRGRDRPLPPPARCHEEPPTSSAWPTPLSSRSMSPSATPSFTAEAARAFSSN